ncbi:MAG: hypothetical protein QN194_14025 [Armatimonadota bacterium]|nr:hypothetical protein [Armatimonadota bacterium]
MRKATLAAGLFLISLYLNLAAGINRGDEAWFLQVMRRVREGEVLYRDVFYGAGPLAVAFTAPLVSLIGVEIIAVKAVVAAGYTASLLFGIRILERMGAGAGSRMLFLGANLLLAPPAPHAPYQSLANAFLMAAFDATTAAQAVEDSRARRRLLAWAGAAAGLSFTAKQNIGVYALLAILGAILARREEERLSLRQRAIEIGTPGIAFLGTLALTFLPIWASGGGPKFMDYGVLNKPTYLRLSGIPYTEGLVGILRSLQALSPRSTLEQGLWALRSFSFLLPFLAGFFWIGGFFVPTSSGRASWIASGLFASAAFLGVFPRADYAHIIYAVPALLTVMIGGWSAWPIRPWKIVLERGIGALLILGLIVALMIPPLRLLQGRLTISSLPHFRGPLIAPALQAQILEETARLRTRIPEPSVFLLFPTAGFYYLQTGLRNPTPFDIPTATSFGRVGQEETMQAIREGRIRWVCYWRWEWNLRPVRIEAFVEQEMEPVEDLGLCTLYRVRP